MWRAGPRSADWALLSLTGGSMAVESLTDTEPSLLMQLPGSKGALLGRPYMSVTALSCIRVGWPFSWVIRDEKIGMASSGEACSRSLPPEMTLPSEPQGIMISWSTCST